MAIRTFEGITPTIAESAYIDDMAVVIGAVTIGADASLWPMVVARGDVQTITIGERTNVQDGSVLHVTSDNVFTPGGFALTIGADVTIGHGAILHACSIGNLCLIGMGATVLDGAVVPERTMIGAGALVPPGKRLESGYLYIGSPVRQARPLKQAELDYLEFSSRHYVELKNRHLC